MNNTSINQLLNDYKLVGCDYAVLDSIDSDDLNKFVKILSKEKADTNTMNLNVMLNRVFSNKNDINKRQFFEYIVDNDGKYGWNIVDYTIIIAYCAQQSNFKLLSKIIKNVDKTKYNLDKKFQKFQGSHKWVPEIMKFSHLEKRSTTSILHFCVRSRCLHCHKNVEYNASDFDINIRKNKEIIDLINDKNNDNYKCFELLITTTNIFGFQVDDTFLIYDCYENGKNSFVECLISNNKCKDYSGVLIHCCKYPQRWKIGSLSMLLNEYKHVYEHDNEYDNKHDTSDDDHDDHDDDGKQEEDNKDKRRRVDLFTSDYKLREYVSYNGYDSLQPVNSIEVAETNCLQWCVNIGMQSLSQERFVGTNKDDDVSSSTTSDSIDSARWNGVLNYNSDSMDAAFECFRLIMECKNISRKRLNKLLDTRMKDNIHIIETCMANSNVNNSFIKYLISNNGKKGWKIDYRETNVLQLACLVGNYTMLKMIINDVHSGGNTMTTINLENVVNQFGLTPKIFTLERHDTWLNNFQSINFYKTRCKQFGKVRNLLYCCINTNESIVLNFDLDPRFRPPNLGFLYQLNSNTRKLLCLGYLRNGGYDNNVSNIEYPDNIATVLYRYIDWEFGTMQCFKYLMNNLRLDKFDFNINNIEINSDKSENKKISCQLYPRIVYDCILQCKTAMLRILVEKCKKTDININGHDSIYEQLYSLFPLACFTANSSMMKYLLSLFKKDKNFDINAAQVIDELARGIPGTGAARLLVGKQYHSDAFKSMTKQVKITPLFAVVLSNAEMIKLLRQSDNEDDTLRLEKSNFYCNVNDELECFKTLLFDRNINPTQQCMGRTLFIHCIESNKIHLIKYIFDLVFNNNNSNNCNNKYEFDFKTIPDEYDDEYLDCLVIALNHDHFEMIQFLLKNIIKHKIFPIDEIATMCQKLLFLVVDKAIKNRFGDDCPFDMFKYLLTPRSEVGPIDIFKYILGSEELIKNKETDERFAVLTQELIDKCLKYKMIQYLEYMMNNWKFLSSKVENDQFNESENLIKIKQCTQQQKNLKHELYPFFSRNNRIITSFCDSGGYSDSSELQLSSTDSSSSD